MTDVAPEPEGSEEETPEPEGSEEEFKRKFREALERKQAGYADANAAHGGKDAGKVHGARGLARAGVHFAARPAAKRLTERTMQRPDDHRMGTARRYRIPVALAGYQGQSVMVMDPAIESHYGIGHERSRLFPEGEPTVEFVRSVELLERLLPAPPARVLDVGGGPGTYAAPLARRGYSVHLVDPVPLHVEQARQAAGADPAAGFTAALGDARDLAEPAESADAVLLFGPLYHLTEAAGRQRALAEARRVLTAGGRLLAMAVCRFASLLDGLHEGWLDDPVFRRIVDQDLADGQHRNPDPAGRPEFFTTAYFHTPDGLTGEIEQGLHRRGRLRSRGPGLATASGVDRPAAARADPVCGPRRRDRAFPHRLQRSPHRRRDQGLKSPPRGYKRA